MRRSLLLLPIVPALLLIPAVAQEKEVRKSWPERNPKAAVPDKQPETGPGGKDYAHAEVEVSEQGEGALRFWLYTPAEPKPQTAPVVAFIHGYGALEPRPYLAWLHHICRRGNIVIYPQYQKDAVERPANYAPNSAAAVLAAFAWLEADETRVQPIKEKFAIAGHSAGGVTTANLAADWETLKLPRPLAAMPVQPGRAMSFNPRAQKNGLIPLSDFSKIPGDCLLLCVYGDSDQTVGAWCARRIFMDAGVKSANKNLVEFVSSDYGLENRIAGHFTPAAPERSADHWDWYGYWKLLDGLTDAAFHGRNREYALGGTTQQKFMGEYSDGRPFEELRVWLGDEKVDPDAAFLPAFDRTGQRRKER